MTKSIIHTFTFLYHYALIMLSNIAKLIMREFLDTRSRSFTMLRLVQYYPIWKKSEKLELFFHGTIFTWNCFYMELFFHGTIFSWDCFYMELFLHGTVITWNCFYAELLLYGTVFYTELFFMFSEYSWIFRFCADFGRCCFWSSYSQVRNC